MPSRTHACLRLLVLLAALLASARAAAAEPAPRAADADTNKAAEQSPAYREAIAQALNEYELAHYEEARTLFAKAHDLAPSARTWRGLGMAEFELRNYLASIDDLENALRDPVRPLSGSLRGETEALLARAREFVTRVELSLQPAAESSLSVDGAPAERRADGSLVLPVGEHVLEVSAPGYLPERRKLSLVGGRTERVQIMLAHETAVAPSSVPPADTPRRPLYKSPWLWVGVGVVVAGAVALGVGLGLRDDPQAKPIQGSPEVGGGLVHTLRFGR